MIDGLFHVTWLPQASYLSAFTTFLWTCAPFLVAVSSFTAYILVDDANVLDAQTAFVSLTYFNLLRMPLNMLPQLIVLMVQCSVSLRRINKFMNADELVIWTANFKRKILFFCSVSFSKPIVSIFTID